MRLAHPALAKGAILAQLRRCTAWVEGEADCGWEGGIWIQNAPANRSTPPGGTFFLDGDKLAQAGREETSPRASDTPGI